MTVLSVCEYSTKLLLWVCATQTGGGGLYHTALGGAVSVPHSLGESVPQEPVLSHGKLVTGQPSLPSSVDRIRWELQTLRP